MLKSQWRFSSLLALFMVTCSIAQNSHDDHMSTLFLDSTDEPELGASSTDVSPISEQRLVDLLKKYDEKSSDVCNRAVIGSWNVATDIGNKSKEEIKVRKHTIIGYSIKNIMMFDVVRHAMY